MTRQTQLTSEDEDIWTFVGLLLPWLPTFVLEDHSAESDRSDAAKMLNRMSMQVQCDKNGHPWKAERREWFPSQWGHMVSEEPWGWHNPGTPR
jgi:hypothetical protein